MSFSCPVSFWEEKKEESITFPNCTRACLVKKNNYLLLTKHEAKVAGYWPISLTETKLRSIKFYAKKNESNNQAKKRTFSCRKSRGARLAHLDHSSSQSECRICLILPACGFSHIIITTRTRIIIYSLYLLCCAHQLPSEDEVLLQKLREESRAVFLQRKSRELLDNDELQVRRSS